MELDWSTLRRLRAGFLEGTAGADDYWRSLADLAQYDATFAQRIGWKWDFVLDDLQQLGWQPPAGVVLDWGCGSGVASRAFLDHFGKATARELWLNDRSSQAVQFAAERAIAKYPSLPVKRGVPDQIDLLIVSHVLTELAPAQVEELANLARHATAVLWVEPGTYETSLTLIAIRERLRNEFNVVAPCPHQARCGILSAGNESHWCHQFASPPEFVFTDTFWTAFSRMMEIDLRSLPLSYLVLDRRPVAKLPPNAVRMLGRPELFKPHASLLGCTEAGLLEGALTKREHPEEYRHFKKRRVPSLQCWECEGTRIKSWKEFGAPTSGPA